MITEHVEQLENIISSFIINKYIDVAPKEEEFLEEATKLRTGFAQIMQISDKSFEEIIARLKQKLTIQMDVGVYINDQNNGHNSWLPSKRADIDFFFWDRYKKYLEESKHWNPRVTSNLGRVSDEILDLCGDPSEERFSIKGLVLGDIQSGKTANYTAICNKAADVGYRIIIVLAGMQENLRRQTQERLDAECTGRKSEYYLDPRAEVDFKDQPVGVGRYGTEKKIVAFTSVTKDFDSGVLRNNNLGIENVNCPVVLVVKKNKKILNNLIQWLSVNNTKNASGQIDLPLMLIDDEADNASVNTKDEESQPTAINDCIRRLLKLFSKTTYLGITATPFANIFIDSENDDDLFPADFIYALSAPTNYIGADRILGENADSDHMLEEINMFDLEDCFPKSHKKNFKVEELPSDLYEASYYFLLLNAIRDYRGDKKEHRSMMVHVSLYTNVQDEIRDILNFWLDQVKVDVRYFSNNSHMECEKIKNIKELHSVWDKHKLSEITGIVWEDLLRNYLHKAISPIEVRSVNMKTGSSSLDYFNRRNDGLRVIAVGGNSMSRGLTLEGLGVSYFHRNTKMYDTLLQMGRWFGYRPNYEDITKIWMTPEGIDWYGQITMATAELKNEITKMRSSNQTPRDFGLKVRQDPGALIITARNKMRTATDLTYPVTVSGNLLETPRLKSSRNILASNEKVFKNFVNSLSSIGTRYSEIETTKGHYFWKNVSNSSVAQLLLDFETNPWHLSFNGKALSEFINDQKWDKIWDVVLINSGTGKSYDGLQCGSEKIIIKNTEKRKILVDNKMISVSGTKLRVGSGGCTKIGLTKKEISNAESAYRAIEGNENVINIPDKAYLISKRPPILMLHIINIDTSLPENKDIPEFIFAIGVGFPETNGSTKTATYKVNQVELRTWVDVYDNYDEEL